MSAKSVRLARKVAQCRSKRGNDLDSVRILLTPGNAKGRRTEHLPTHRPGFTNRLARFIAASK